MIQEATLQKLEGESPQGLTSAQILGVFAAHGVNLSEATLRKYVQLGLLPRSVRVGEKGKHRGSRGLYPARVVRRILLIKSMMAEQYTIEQIQNELLFLTGEIDQLEETLADIFVKLQRDAAAQKRAEGRLMPQAAVADLMRREVQEAQRLGKELVGRLRKIELRLRNRQAKARGESVVGLLQAVG